MLPVNPTENLKRPGDRPILCWSSGGTSDEVDDPEQDNVCFSVIRVEFRNEAADNANIFTAEFDRATTPGYADWLAATFWTSDVPSAAGVSAEVLRTCYRAAHLQCHGAPTTLGGLLRQEALAARFTDLVGEPAKRYITRWRMQLARIRLQDSPDSVAVLADRFGYQSEAAFSRAFKREFGVSPRQVRRGPTSSR